MNRQVSCAMLALLLITVISSGCSDEGATSPLDSPSVLDPTSLGSLTTGTDLEVVGNPDKSLWRVRGHVYYMDGSPAAGVEVMIRYGAYGAEWLDPIYRTTDTSGFFAYSREYYATIHYVQCGALNCQDMQLSLNPYVTLEFRLTEQEELPPGKEYEPLQEP